MGSVKDVVVLKEPTATKTGVGHFHFSDRYSVFDWGEMPDLIPHKGESLCLIGAYFLERLEEEGIQTHYRGLIEEDKRKRLSDLSGPTEVMEVQLLRVLKPEIRDGAYDYSVYQKKEGNCLIPLEIVFRNYLSANSSLRKRLVTGQISLKSLGLQQIPGPEEPLAEPILDLSTKLEITDRPLTWSEGMAIAGLSDKEATEIKRLTLLANQMITRAASTLGLICEDGKVEFGFDEERQIIFVDVLGTPDECRFSYRGIPVSKEVVRTYYRQTAWFQELEKTKEKDRMGWRRLVKNQPPLLPKELREAVGFLYQAFCNQLTGRRWFDAPGLEEILGAIPKMLEIC